MPITIIEPDSDGALVGVDQPIALEALVTAPESEGDLEWVANVPGEAPDIFASADATVVYTTPASVNGADVAGNAGLDAITITASDKVTGVTARRIVVLVNGIPRLADTQIAGTVTDTVAETAEEPRYRDTPGGPADSSSSAAAELMEESQVEPHECGCAGGGPSLVDAPLHEPG